MTNNKAREIIVRLYTNSASEAIKQFQSFYNQDLEGLNKHTIKGLENIDQALKELYEVAKERIENNIKKEELAKIVLFIRRSAFLPENNKLEELKKMINSEVFEVLKEIFEQ